MKRTVAIALLALGSSDAFGQATVRGTLLRADSFPAAGVIVVATRGAPDSVLSRTITNGGGQYTLALSPGEVRLRALRIGHRPFEIATFTLAAGGRRDVRTVLPNDPIVLAAVTTEANSSCRQTGTAGTQVAEVFEEARKALLSTTLRWGDGDPLARLSVFEQARGIGNRVFREPELQFQEGVTVKPFQSLSPDSLAKVGYMVSEPNAWQYYAPDADVLLSETFAATHCLGLTQGTGERAGWIGLTFRPSASRRDYVDVRGTLWLDRASNELRRMEFTYEGLPLAMQRAGAGGEVEFTRLPMGIWFVSRWELWMPRMTLPPGTPRLMGLWVRGGDVWWIRIGSTLVYSNGRVEPAPKGLAAARAAARAVADSVQASAACAPTEADDPGGILRGVVTDDRGAPLADAVVTVEWQQGHSGGARGLSWETRGLSTVSAADGSYAICGVPTNRLLGIQVQLAMRRTPTVSTRVPQRTREARVDVRVSGVRAPAPPGGGTPPPAGR
ncbi:MAG: carboxypeptidase regulatory-like domain-containing protein [Gemmatimonadetes bacterium]|nr:carboxypeptidase regulatory-like domain-containing protein [Gemmatimonadota bacterium]